MAVDSVCWTFFASALCKTEVACGEGMGPAGKLIRKVIDTKYDTTSVLRISSFQK